MKRSIVKKIKSKRKKGLLEKAGVKKIKSKRKKGLLEKAGNTIRGAGETLENWGYIRTSNKNQKSMKKRLVNQKAEKNYRAVYGDENYEKANFKGTIPFSKSYKNKKKLNKMKDNINKNKYGYL